MTNTDADRLGAEYVQRDRGIGVRLGALKDVGPGEARTGLMALQLPPVNPDVKKTQPTVLQLLFTFDRAGSLTATLVL